MQQRDDGPMTSIHPLRNLRNRPGIQMPQPNRFRLIIRQPADGPRQPDCVFSPHQPLTGAGQFALSNRLDFDLCCFRIDRPPLGFNVLARRIDQIPLMNLLQPCGELFGAVTGEFRKPTDGRKVRLLHNVGIVEPPGQPAIHRPLCEQPEIRPKLVEQNSQSLVITSLSPLKQQRQILSRFGHDADTHPDKRVGPGAVTVNLKDSVPSDAN